MPRNHTVGAEIENLRVPEKYLDTLVEINDLLKNVGQHDSRINILGKIASIFSGVSTNTDVNSELHDRGVLSSDRANFEKRYQPDYEKVSVICEAMRLIGHTIVLTSGTFDIIHIGHAQYIQAAGEYGDFLIVGVDSDEKVRNIKGKHRPVVPQEERLRMLSHLRGVGLITLKNFGDPKWHLIKMTRPDTLIATEGTYTPNEIVDLESNWVGRVKILPPQAITSTTARLRKVQVAHAYDVQENMLERINSTVASRVSPEILEEIVKIIIDSTNE